MRSVALEEIMIVPEGHRHRERPHNPSLSPGSAAKFGTLNMSDAGMDMPTAKPETAQQYSMRRPSTPPFYLLEGLYQQARLLNPYVFAKVKQTQQQIEDRVYRMHEVDRQKYIEECYMKKGLLGPNEEGSVEFYLRGMLSQVMWRSQQKVLNDIEDNKLLVYKKKQMGKEDLAELEKLDQMRLIKIREGELKSKLQVLNEKMEQVKYYSEASFKKSAKKEPSIDFAKIEDQLDFESYGLDSTRTKLASEFIIKKRQERIQRSRRRRLQLERQTERMMHQDESRNYNKHVIVKEKHDEVLSQYQKKKKQQQQQRQKQARKQAQFMKFLEEYKAKKPLYQQKQLEYEKKYVIPKQKQRESRLKQIHLNHRPISLEQMTQHQKNYLEKKAQNMAKRQEEMRMIVAQRQLQKKDHFKGHFHEVLAEQSKHIDPFEDELTRRQKRKQYGQKLKVEYKPLIDQKKKKQLQDLVALTDRKNKRLKKKKIVKIDTTQDINSEGAIEYTYEEVPEGDHKKDGLKYLQFARRIGERMKLKNKKQSPAKESQTPSQVDTSIVQPTPRSERPRKNLSQHEIMLRQRRHLNSWQQDLKSQRLSQQEKLQRVYVKSVLLDDKARNKEQLLRLAHFQNPDMQIKQKADLDEHYISSIKAKVALLSMND